MKITVLISTRDRCKKLAAALRALDETYVPPGVSVDVLVIDNGSADATADVCAKFAQVAKVGFCYIYESKRGKSNALNSGLSQSDSDVVAFTDDDCLVDKNWIVGIAREFANDTDLSILGGCSRLFDAKDKPLSISKNFTRTTVRRDDTRREKSDIELIVGKGDLDAIVIGCNMAVRRRAFAQIGRFDVLLGPGTPLVAEDVDLVYRAYRKGLKMLYDPSILIYHDHGRQSDSEEADTLRYYMRGRGAMYLKHVLLGDRSMLAVAVDDLYGTTKTLVKGLITRTQFPFHWLLLTSLLVGAMSYLSAAMSVKRATKGLR